MEVSEVTLPMALKALGGAPVGCRTGVRTGTSRADAAVFDRLLSMANGTDRPPGRTREATRGRTHPRGPEPTPVPFLHPGEYTEGGRLILGEARYSVRGHDATWCPSP